MLGFDHKLRNQLKNSCKYRENRDLGLHLKAKLRLKLKKNFLILDVTLGAELREIQKHIDSLHGSTDPTKVRYVYFLTWLV